MMFVDATALVAIALGESDAVPLAEQLEAAVDPVTSPIAVFEAVLAIARIRQGGLAAARADLDVLIRLAGIGFVTITPEDADIALSAFERFGKGQRHPARLNMGDCFAYASARRRRARLLFKGADFTKTDVNAGIA